MSDRHSSKSASKSASASSSPSPPPRKHKKRSKRTPPSRESSKSMSRSLSRSRRRYSRSRSFDRRDGKGGRPRYDYDDGRYGGRRRSPSFSPPSRSRRYMGDRKSLQEHPPESRCLGVFGLNLRTDERQLRSVFEKYGPIDDIQLVYDYHSGMSRGFGFIYYKYVEDAIEARDSASGMDVDGRKIRVDFSITQRAHTPTPGTYLGRGGPRGGGGGGSRYSRRSPGYRSGQRSYSRSRSISPRVKEVRNQKICQE